MAVAVLSEYANKRDLDSKRPISRETFFDIAECISAFQEYVKELVMPYDVLQDKMYYTIDIMDFSNATFTDDDRATMELMKKDGRNYDIGKYHYNDGTLLARWTYETLSGKWRDYIKLH